MTRPWVRVICLVLASAFAGCGPSVSNDDDDDDDDLGDAGGGDCSVGATRCEGNVFLTCEDGTLVPQEECPDACHDQLGCTLCRPGTGICESATVAQACLPDGSGYEEELCDPVQGVSCDPASGVCEGACAPSSIGESYIGCEYYPTITGNLVSNDFSFAVVVANTSGEVASVTIEDGALTAPITFTVPGDSVVVQDLPWQNELKLCAYNGSDIELCRDPVQRAALVANGAYHLRSTVPVTVYQFSPLDYTLGGGTFSYTNDASLLMPTNAWTGSYLAAGWKRLDASPLTSGTWPGLLAVTAAQDATTVTITTTAPTEGYGAVPAFATGVPQTITLNAGDVVEIASWGTFGGVSIDDLTGSSIEADKPVQVIGGHYCAYVPDNVTAACDHLEESMFPIEALSTTYVVTTPAVPALPNGKEQVVRIVATQPATTLTYDPPQAGAPTTIANAGGYVEMARQTADYVVTADHKVMVIQYMEGQDAGGGTGDPAMTLAVPTDQYRDNYLFHAPLNYETNYVNITAPTGATVTLDGAAVTGFTALGASGFGLARVVLGPGTGGNHTITGSMPFGISVYGYGQYTSYWYPGGLDLANIPVE
jgi:hypothetical protein